MQIESFIVFFLCQMQSIFMEFCSNKNTFPSVMLVVFRHSTLRD